MKNITTVAGLLAAIAVVAAFIYFNKTPTDTRPDTVSSAGAPPAATTTNSGVDGNLPDIPERLVADSDNRAQQKPTPAELQERYAAVSDNPDYPDLQTRLKAMRERRPDRSFDAEQVVDALSRREAWERVQEPPEELPLTRVQKFDGREFIRFNEARIETLMPGDTLEIPIWQLGERYIMRVDRTEVHNNGSVTWHGHLENFNELHRVTITVGDGLSVGGIDTPRGHYVLQAHEDLGWVASSETLFKRNQNETDMIIPPEGGPGPNR